MIGRLTFVDPSETERFYLRLLLANVRGPTSFTDLKTVNGFQYSSFQEACIKRGLVEQCEAADKCLKEATTFQMPHALRSLFAMVLIFCHPPNPSHLWNKYYQALSEDFLHSFPNSEAHVLALTTEKIEQQLETMGRQLAEFGLEHLKDVQPVHSRLTRNVRDAYNAPVTDQYVRARKELNTKQKAAYKSISHHVKQGIPGAFFVDGPGGTGKTFLYNALYAKLRLMGKIVLPTASSGIAAGCLPNGRTAHSRFKLPIDIAKSLSCDVPKQGSLASLLRETTMIIWDEAPMAHKANIHALDSLLRDLCSSTLIFGGKIVVFGGDFRQVLPVLPQKTQIEAVESSLVSSTLWPEFTRFHLEDPSFASFLLNLGNGKLQEVEQSPIDLPSTIATPMTDITDSIDQLTDFLFPQRTGNTLTANTFDGHAILTTTNDEVDRLNKALIDRFEDQQMIYHIYIPY